MYGRRIATKKVGTKNRETTRSFNHLVLKRVCFFEVSSVEFAAWALVLKTSSMDNENDDWWGLLHVLDVKFTTLWALLRS